MAAKEVWDEYSRLQSPVDVVAHWKCDRLDANGWIPDDSGNAPLNPVRGVTLVDDEFRGKALFFDGMNKTYASAVVSNLMPRFTFAAWLKMPTDRNAADVDPENANNYPRIFQTSAGNPRIQCRSDTNDLTITTYHSAELPPSSRVKFYVDGQEITTASVAVDGNPTDATGNYVLNLVARNNTNARWGGISTVNRYFPGVLDEMRYYTNVLSQAQIARLAFEFSPENRAPIVEVPTGTVRVSAGKAFALQGAAFDDGNGTLACAWDVVEGDKSLVVFDDETNPLSGVVFRKAGKYTLVLRASDGELATVSDPVAVDILPRGSVVSFR